MVKEHGRHKGKGVNVELCCDVWKYLEDEGPMKMTKLKKNFGLPEQRIMQIMNSLSAHNVPIYEDEKKHEYGALITYSRERVIEALFSKEDDIKRGEGGDSIS